MKVLVAIQKRLIDDGDISALCSTRVFIGTREQETNFPALAITADGNEPHADKDTASKADRWTITVQSFESTAEKAIVLSELVRDSLDNFMGTITTTDPAYTVQISRIRYVSQDDNFFESGDGIFSVVATYHVWELKQGGEVQYPSGVNDPVSIIDQDDVEIASVDPGGTYQVEVLEEIIDLGTGNDSTIIDPL